MVDAFLAFFLFAHLFTAQHTPVTPEPACFSKPDVMVKAKGANYYYAKGACEIENEQGSGK